MSSETPCLLTQIYHTSSGKQTNALLSSAAAGVSEEDDVQQGTTKLPRRFRTAFIQFSSFRHKQIRRDLREKGIATKVRQLLGKEGLSSHPWQQTSQVSKRVGADWRNLSAVDRLYWENQASTDRRRFDLEMIDFRSVQDQSCQRKPPKRPMSAFLAFSKDRRPHLREIHKGMPNKDLAKLLSREWHNLPSHERDAYKQEYHARMKDYQKEMKPFRRKTESTDSTTSLESMGSDSEGQHPPASSQSEASSLMDFQPSNLEHPNANEALPSMTTLRHAQPNDDVPSISSRSGRSGKREADTALTRLRESYEAIVPEKGSNS